jgi:hypothetical protein
MTAGGPGSLEDELGSLTERLVARFADRLDRRAIEDTVRQHAASFADARVETFVPLFVERVAVADLLAKLSEETDPVTQ